MASKSAKAPATKEAPPKESLLAKAFQFSPDITKMETLDCIFWFRQLMGLLFGVGAGVLHLTGLYVIVGFVMGMFTLSQLYGYRVLNASDDDFQNSELQLEGLANSIGIFLLSWIVCFSFL